MSSNGYINKETAAFVRLYKDVDLPDGTKARIQNFSNRETEELQLALLTESGKPNIEAAIIGQRARVIVKGWVDAEGARHLGDGQEGWVQDEMDPAVADALSDAIVDFTGINENGIERLKKRFAETQGSSSPTS